MASIVNPYSDVHKSPNGPDDARPSALQILRDINLLDNGLVGKTILITGGTDGLGLETVRALARTGASVFFTARNEAKAQNVMKEVLTETPGVKVDWVKMDNASLKSVREGAESFLNKSAKLNVLICNAGVANVPLGQTADGFELHFGVNHLAHFLLFQLLQPVLLSSSTPSFHSRVITVSSCAHAMSTVHIGNYNLTTKPTSGYAESIEVEDNYHPVIAYAQSKTANIWFTNEIERRYADKGLHGISVHPGWIFTNAFTGMDPLAVKLMEPFTTNEEFRKIFKSKQQGAATQVLAAVGKAYEGKGGLYLEDCGPSRPLKDGEMPGVEGYPPFAFDKEGAAQLWEDSLEMVGTKDVE